VDKRLAQVLPWGTAYFLFLCDDYYSEKKQNITNFGFTHKIKQLMSSQRKRKYAVPQGNT
jgi:hypothetical protein